ncbi:MAG: competence protein ComEC [Candidatus Paceibacteria bacterium]|jgi:competence protein ComEC
MSRSWLKIRIFVLLVLAGASVLLWFPNVTSSSTTSNYLTVRFLDVEQGDAIQVITPDGYEMLIDGGPSSAVLLELAKDRSFFDRSIDVVMATHPDTDHVAGLSDVFERYSVSWLFETSVESKTSAAVAYRRAAQDEGAHIITAQAGQTVQLGASTTVRILSPKGDTTHWSSNSASIIVQIIYGDIEFMLTGDAPSSIEEYLVGKYSNTLESEVLKLGHHGSKTSSSDIFLDAVEPQFVVVSAGKDNRYGHPHSDVVEKAEERGSEIVSTTESGTITFETDGNTVWLVE